MRPTLTKTLVLVVACGFAALSAGGAVPYEEPPVVEAGDLLPAELLKGPHHTVDSGIPTDGFMAYVTIRSDYGVYKTASIEEAATRVHEIYAIAALDDMKRYELAGQAVVEGVRQPFLAAKSVVTRPVETLQNVGDGIGRWFERGKLSLRKAKKKTEEVAEDAKEAYDERRAKRRSARLADQEVRDRAVAEGRDPETAVAEYEHRLRTEKSSGLAAGADAQRKRERIEWAEAQLEKAALKYVGYDKARRQLASQLGVDPYSTNLQLQERLDGMAWALWAGRFGSGFVVPSNDLLTAVTDVNKLVWATRPKDLEVRNRKQMRRMRVDRDVIDAFFDSSFYSTSDRTQMLSDLTTLAGVRDRRHFFHLAAAADTWLLGDYFLHSARLLARAHRERTLVRLVESDETIVAAMSRKGELVLILAVDYLSWTEGLDLVTGAVERQHRAAGFASDVALLVGGGVTAKARQGIEALGWTLEAHKLER